MRLRMFFQQSANIVKAHESLAELIGQIDELIYENGEHPIRPDFVSDSLCVEDDLLERVLNLYVAAGVLRRDKCKYCGECETLIDDEDDPSECDECETPFSRKKPDEFVVFVPVDPVIRTEDFDADQDELPEPCRIQFVGGDRSGGTQSVLQLPKEHKAIVSGLKQSNFPRQFTLIESVYAATIEELGDLYVNQPRLIHFAGHGDERSLSFVKDQELLASSVPVTAEKLGRILSHYPQPIAAIVFNTCNSAGIARALVENGVVEIAIGWEGKVGDSAAITFSELFYKHLGNGLAVGRAFGIASECSVSDAASFQGKLFCRDGINPKSYFLHTK